MRMKESIRAALLRRRAALAAEISVGFDDPDRFVFMGTPVTVRTISATGELSPVDPRHRPEGPAEVFGLGFATEMRTDEQAVPLLRHLLANLEEGGTEMARKLSSRLANFARTRMAGPRTSLSRKPLRESGRR